MKKYSTLVIIALVFIFLSTILYILHLYIFSNLHHLLIFGLEDIAFLPLEVLLVTFIFHKVIQWHDKQVQVSKMNILIGTFFSKVGIQILQKIINIDKNSELLRENLDFDKKLTNEDLKIALNFAENYEPELSINSDDFYEISNLLSGNNELLTNLMQNPILIEDKSFTDLLLATFHLNEELSYRNRFEDLINSDFDHLRKDAQRVYIRLIPEWLKYIKSIQYKYPYLSSLYLRINPIKKETDITVK